MERTRREREKEEEEGREKGPITTLKKMVAKWPITAERGEGENGREGGETDEYHGKEKGRNKESR